MSESCPFSGVKRTSLQRVWMSANDPKRTSRLCAPRLATIAAIPAAAKLLGRPLSQQQTE
jgi:hypothetical protein